ncbi:hypothetical protein GCM10007036_36570 [Alsobacter metallidurans]|uniref:Uncharacterized protein n=1 Tax=Alsobacter metallidurans TaxID=340221 RepID=A0A917IA12_9HYPH|nr:hypothetical protein GCM10007036_36570 [Alsobacter metallidurans]
MEETAFGRAFPLKGLKRGTMRAGSNSAEVRAYLDIRLMRVPDRPDRDPHDPSAASRGDAGDE